MGRGPIASFAIALMAIAACSGGPSNGGEESQAPEVEEASDAEEAAEVEEAAAPGEVAAARICEDIEREPSNHVAYEEFTRDFDREVRAGIDETELSDALDATCGRLIAAIGPPLETSERQDLSRAEELAQRICVAMGAEESADLAYLEFEMMAQPALATGLDEDDLYDALVGECGSLLSEVAPVFGSEPLMQDRAEDPRPTQSPPQGEDHCPQDRPEGTEYLACVDGVVVGMADSYCDVSYDLFKWYGVAANFNPYPVDVVMTFDLLTDAGTRTGDGIATVWNLQPDADARFEVHGTSIDAGGATCRVSDIRVTRSR